MPQESSQANTTDLSSIDDLPAPLRSRSRVSSYYPWLVVASFLAGLLISDMVWGSGPRPVAAQAKVVAASVTNTAPVPAPAFDLTALQQQVNPPAGYQLAVRYGDLGPRLLATGAIDYQAFAAVYDQSGDPLTAAQVNVLTQGTDQPIVITSQDAHFLLNFFWAVGLVNKNSILTDGPMVTNSGGQIERFASTGGWTLGSKPVKELYASVELIPLTAEQQQRVEEVAAGVYRPCCGNATLFPDCNHGMAMLGLLELMASQGASMDQMFTAAKYVNAFWFPQQSLEAAMYLKSSEGLDFIRADPRIVTGKDFSSGAGAQRVHALLQSEGLLPKAPDGAGGCGT